MVLLLSSTAGAELGAEGLPPRYTGPAPNWRAPLGGLPLLAGAEHFRVFKATPAAGTYAHQPQLTRSGGHFHLAWDNGPFNEDSDGQRVLYAASGDGRNWSEHVELFPSMPAQPFAPTLGKVHLRTLPFVSLNGRLYAAATARRSGAVGIYPVVSAEDRANVLLRRVLRPAVRGPVCCPGPTRSPSPGPGPGPARAAPAGGARAATSAATGADGAANTTCAAARWTRPAFGPLTWATGAPPPGLENATAALGIRTAADCGCIL